TPNGSSPSLNAIPGCERAPPPVRQPGMNSRSVRIGRCNPAHMDRTSAMPDRGTSGSESRLSAASPGLEDDRPGSPEPHPSFPADIWSADRPSDDSRRPHTRLIGSRYEVINELAQGAMGSVFRALDRLTGHVVTLKRLRMPALPAIKPPSEDAILEERLALAQE